MVAGAVGDFLRSVEGDLQDLALLPPSAGLYSAFWQSHQKEIWHRTGIV